MAKDIVKLILQCIGALSLILATVYVIAGYMLDSNMKQKLDTFETTEHKYNAYILPKQEN